MEVNIADLTWSSFVYPRGGKNEEKGSGLRLTLACGKGLIIKFIYKKNLTFNPPDRRELAGFMLSLRHAKPSTSR